MSHLLLSVMGTFAQLKRDLIRERQRGEIALHYRSSAPAGRRGAQKGGSEDPALGRSRGGLSTKIHLLADEDGLPVAFSITPGQAAEHAQAICLLEGRHANAVIADKGYDSAEIVAKVESLGAVAVIPPRRHWKQPRTYDRALYKQRNRIERCFNALKHFAASAHDTAEPSRPSGPPPHSPAPGSGSSYMRIPPSEAARRRIHETEALSHTGPSEGAAPSRCYRRIEDCARQRTRHQPSDPLSVRSGSREVKGGRQRVMHCPCGNSKILALGLCATCYRLKRQDEECFGGLRKRFWSATAIAVVSVMPRGGTNGRSPCTIGCPASR